MIDAIARLRSTADECECRARKSDSAEVKTEMMDLAARWHWLAGEAAILCRRSKELNGGDDTACASCQERCAG
jgi:hypothetical protein